MSCGGLYLKAMQWPVANKKSDSTNVYDGTLH